MKTKKRRSENNKHLLALVLLLIVFGLISSYRLMVSHADSTRATNAPVVFVHGYLLNTCPGTNPNTTFAGAVTQLKNQKYTGSNDMINYYACDSRGSNIQSSGDPTAYYPGGGYTGINGVKGGNTNNTDIRHISYQLAWYIYNKYSSQGQTVSVVAHSMGGLITTWMLYQIQAHNPLFPPYLYVQDAVTVSTPYAGVNDGYNNISWCPSSTQCRQMLPGSDFIKELQMYGTNPQATNGTDWTAIGGSPCDIVGSNPAGTSLANGDIHKVAYYAKKPPAPVCYNHTSYLPDTSIALDMPIQYSNPGGVQSTGKGPHAMLMMVKALTSGVQ